MPDFGIRYQAWLAALEARQLDGFLVTSPANLNYLFNFSGSAGIALCLDGDTQLVVDSRYIEQASMVAINCRPVLAEKSLQETLRELLRRGHRTGQRPRLGMEGPHISHQKALELKSWRTRAQWVSTHDVIEELRIIKDAWEIKILKQAFGIAQRAYVQLQESIRPGMTESQVAGMLEYELRRAGGQGLAFETIVASGRRSSLPHASATHWKIRDTRPVLIDFGVRHRGYCSDLTRMHRFPATRTPKIYSVVQEAQQAALEAIRPGALCSQVDAAARHTIARHGYAEYFGHSTGHGLGLEIHELPRIASSTREVLKPGMVFTVEPGIYLPKRYGVRIEDAVLVTDKGYRTLSNRTSD